MDGERKVLKMESESVTGITDNDVCVYDNVSAVNVFFCWCIHQNISRIFLVFLHCSWKILKLLINKNKLTTFGKSCKGC